MEAHGFTEPRFESVRDCLAGVLDGQAGTGAAFDGPDYPPTVRMSDATAARRQRRAGRKPRRRDEPSP